MMMNRRTFSTALLTGAAADKTLVGSYHLPFPGFGHVVREGSGYRWLPADGRADDFSQTRDQAPFSCIRAIETTCQPYGERG